MKFKVDFSVITPTYNSQDTIKKNLQSVFCQNFKNYEQIIVDNKSDDNTIGIIKKFNNKKINIISEKDEGLYDAINKGIGIAKGKYISILHSDDYFYNEDVLSDVVSKFNNPNLDIIYGNIIYVNKSYLPVRFWKSKKYKKGLFYYGWSPPHPGFFVRKEIYDKHGLYRQALGNPADVELMYRMLELKDLQNFYYDKIFVGMRIGGVSNRNIIGILKQNITILKFLKIDFNLIKILRFFFFKFINRVKQFYNVKKYKILKKNS